MSLKTSRKNPVSLTKMPQTLLLFMLIAASNASISDYLKPGNLINKIFNKKEPLKVHTIKVPIAVPVPSHGGHGIPNHGIPGYGIPTIPGHGIYPTVMASNFQSPFGAGLTSGLGSEFNSPSGVGASFNTFPGTSGGVYSELNSLGEFNANAKRRCPLCDSSVYSYCGERLLHDACCCLNPYENQLPPQCRYADCTFLHANSCKEHKLITACCCTNLHI